MRGKSKVEWSIILVSSFVCAVAFARPVSAGFPVVSDVIVWNNGASVVLNVTVSHTPQTFFHHLDRVEVNMSGDIRIFPVDYRSELSFIVRCDLGMIEAPVNATVRGHCNVDGYSLSMYGPILVPELSLCILTVLFLTSTIAVAIRKSKLAKAK